MKQNDVIPVNRQHYVTPKGFEQLQKELSALLHEERPKIVETVRWAAGNGDRSENGDYIYGKKRLREIDRRVRYLLKRIENATVVDPQLQKNHNQVFFGATVVYKEENGQQKTVIIVGVDEADITQNKISYTAPVARALLKSKVGDVVVLHLPNGKMNLTIKVILY